MRIQEIINRLNEIRSALANTNLSIEEINAYEIEINQLTEERATLENNEERRSNLLNNIARSAGINLNSNTQNSILPPNQNEARNNEDNYRDIWLRSLQNPASLTIEERTVIANVGAVVPVTTADSIINRVEQLAPILSKITLLRVNGNVKIAVEGAESPATKHGEGATISATKPTLIEVDLTAYEITKYIPISATVKNQTAKHFEAWLVESIAKAIAKQITQVILMGTGTGEGKGISTITWNATNSVTVAAAATPTAENVLTLIGLLNGGYDAEAIAVLSKKTLISQLLPLQDKSKNDLVRMEGKTYYIQGYECMLDDRIPFGEMYIGDFSKYVGNLSEDVTVKSGEKLVTNQIEYLGAALFDGKPADEKAFVKLVKGSA